ncbi:glycosyltransferase family 2 protein [Spirosoma validum]|uniref:Glycosyltransferase n=1 Tax=Spirosoma validum TaxID=2771355 RepID=A0A927AXW8_9BACT|nr:glycosyltransferase family 2 protein [Spirosoma validum]MBD2751866.1 glycosyltransferase [Spirosoma validum]
MQAFSNNSKNNITVSIIIVVYNAKSTITQAIQSVIDQVGSFELVIIDGGSTDGTVDVIKDYENEIDFWVSEPDNGIYDAMNKGVKNSNGKWIYFLGADDVLNPDVINRIQPILIDSKCALVYGDIKYTNGGFFKSHYSFITYIQNTIHHQAAFYNRSLFDNFAYDIKMRIISDYELNLIIYLNKSKYQRINVTVATCSKDGRSRNPKLSYKETNIIRQKYLKGYLELSSRLLLGTKFIVMTLYRFIKKNSHRYS